MRDLEASVVVVTWNGRERLSESLPAIVGQQGVRHEVILVDNGSTDGTTAWVRGEYPSVRLVELSENTGFASGNNRGFEAARAPLVAAINNDAIPDPDWLAGLVSAAAAHPDSGMFASRMVYLHDPEVIDSAGVSLDPLGIAWDRHAGTPVQDDADGMVFGASAGAALYRARAAPVDGRFRRALLRLPGGRRPCLGARAGWGGTRDTCPPPEFATCTRPTWAEDSPLKTYHLGRNKVWLIAKNYPLGPLLRWLPLILAYDAASLPITVWRQRQPGRRARATRRASAPARKSGAAAGTSNHHGMRRADTPRGPSFAP